MVDVVFTEADALFREGVPFLNMGEWVCEIACILRGHEVD